MTIVNHRPIERHLNDSCSCDVETHRALMEARYTEDSAGCWVWNLKPNKHGYGVLWHAKRPWLAHRFAYETLAGRIPNGLSLDHLCRVRNCVRPDHLEPVTYEENWRRGIGPQVTTLIRTGVYAKREDPLDRRAYRSRDAFADDDPRHGTTAGYSGVGCRCSRCRAAHAAAAKSYRVRRAQVGS